MVRLRVCSEQQDGGCSLPAHTVDRSTRCADWLLLSQGLSLVDTVPGRVPFICKPQRSELRRPCPTMGNQSRRARNCRAGKPHEAPLEPAGPPCSPRKRTLNSEATLLSAFRPGSSAPRLGAGVRPLPRARLALRSPRAFTEHASLLLEAAGSQQRAEPTRSLFPGVCTPWEADNVTLAQISKTVQTEAAQHRTGDAITPHHPGGSSRGRDPSSARRWWRHENARHVPQAPGGPACISAGGEGARC